MPTVVPRMTQPNCPPKKKREERHTEAHLQDINQKENINDLVYGKFPAIHSLHWWQGDDRPRELEPNVGDQPLRCLRFIHSMIHDETPGHSNG